MGLLLKDFLCNIARDFSDDENIGYFLQIGFKGISLYKAIIQNFFHGVEGYSTS